MFCIRFTDWAHERLVLVFSFLRFFGRGSGGSAAGSILGRARGGAGRGNLGHDDSTSVAERRHGYEKKCLAITDTNREHAKMTDK